jgi:NAD(P)-dependent dehydrogenase (short-subunit alcohol dehydrogenase family)
MTQPEMQSKLCLVTGASSGLGKAIAAGLARKGATVVLACRDQARGEAALADIRRATGSPNVELMLVDLASLQSVRELAATFKATYRRLSVLVNNAAVFASRRVLTEDGLELMFATNHLGPFLLTNLLLDELRAGAAARVVNITAPSTARVPFDDLQGAAVFRAVDAFGASKICNLLFTYELARRLERDGVTANAVHPGLVRSNLMREAPAAVRWFFGLFSAPPERAAEGPLFVAASRELAGVTGQFFKGRRAIRSSPYARNPQVQRRLWEASADLAGLARLTPA